MRVLKKEHAGSTVLWSVISCGTEHYPPGKEFWRRNKIRDHTDYFVLQYTVAGSIVLRKPDGDTPVPKNHLMIFRHGEDSTYGKLDPQQNYSCKWITLGGLGLAGHYEAFRSEYGSVINLGTNNPIVERIEKLSAMLNSPVHIPLTLMAEAVYRLTTTFFSQAEVGFDEEATPVAKAIHQLAGSPYHPWNIKELAAHCGCSREYLSRRFSDIYGLSPREFLQKKKTERTLYLLEFTVLPISEIAQQVGFPNSESLSRQVQLKTGKLPQEYRKMKKREHKANH